ncbi:uncharacterized protein LOC119823628 [Arvicola amphibius]|uniref:uncharacterized protein LOC119823628 n=1 Tax=Arvicola amphibius TaxID=1047088 RepID=UPI0018E2A5A4|nr:uncharacterized protein LOC119823628 [Arvicola amphibius]
MLLPLLGACAVVGPFHGPEWDPVRDLLSQDQSCRDPRCCGNLIVFCLFLIWQIRQYWYQVSRTSRKNTTKVSPQKWAVPSTRHEAFLGMVPQFFTLGKIRDLDVPVRQGTQKQRWGYRKNVRQQWATQYLLSPRNSCQDLPWFVHTSSESMLCTSSFSSSTRLLPRDNSWDVWQVPWCSSSSQAHPSLDMCQRMEQLLPPFQKEVVPGEPVNLKYHLTSTTLAISPLNFPLVQRSKFCLRRRLPGPLNQQLELPTKKSPDSPQDPSEPQGKTQTVDRDYSEPTPQYTNKRESRREVASEIQASGDFLPVDFGVEKAKALACGNQRLVMETDGEISIPGREKQDQMGTEDREQTEKVWKKTKEPGDKNPSTQALMGEDQEQFRGKTDIATQTPEWESKEDAMGTLARGKKNEKEARRKDEAEAQDQGSETQSWTGSKNSENSQMLTQGTQDQTGGNTGTETEAGEGRNKETGGEVGMKIQTSGRENLREVKQQDNGETQALRWEKQGCIRTQDEVQTPAGKKQGWRGNARQTQVSKREDQNLSRQEVRVGLKKLKEIKEEDWVVLQASCWGNQRLVLIAMDRGLKISCWGNQDQVGGEYAAGSLTLEAEYQGQHRGKTEPCPVESKNEGKTGKENGTDELAPGERDLRGANGEDEARPQTLGEENWDRLGNAVHKKIHIPKQKNQEQTRDNKSINKQIPEAENWEEKSSHHVDDTTHTAGCKEAEKAGHEDGAEVLTQGMRLPRGAGGEEGTETKAAMKESQTGLGSNMGTNTHSSESNNQTQVGREDGMEVQAPEKRNQREPGDDDVKTQRPESEIQGQLTETGGSCSTRWRSWEQARGENASENGALEKKNWREAGGEDGKKIQRARRRDQRVLNEANGQTHLLEWKTQQNFRDGDDAEIQNQGKRNLRNFTGDGDPETQASVGQDQRQSGNETDGKIQTQGQRIQSKGPDAAAEIQDVEAQRKHSAEDSEQSHVRRIGGKGHIRRKDAVRPSLQGDSSVTVGSTGRKYSLVQPASLIFRHKQPLGGNGVDSVPCPEEHLSSQGTAPARKHRGLVTESSQGAQPGSQRRQERDKPVDAGKASMTCQHPHPQSQACSVFPSLLCPQVSQAAPALASAPVLTALPKGPALKKSKHLLLESLMKRRIAHLRWGLPRRILESYLLFHFLESCSLPRAGVRLPGVRTNQDRQRQQERHCEPQGSPLGPESQGSSQSCPVLERKSSKLSTQVQALEKCRPPKSEPTGSSMPPKKPRRTRPPGGAKEPQIQEDALKANIPAPRNPRPAAESKSWCGPGQVQELSTESSRGRKMARSRVSHVEERASSRVRALSCTEGHSHWKKECIPREASELPRLKCQQPPPWRSRSLGPAESRGAWQLPFPSSARVSSFKNNVQSAAARLSMTILNKMPRSPQPAKLQHSAPLLTLRNPTPLSKVSDPYTRADGTSAPTALERDGEPPERCCAGVTAPQTGSYEEHEAPGNQNGAPPNPAVSQKSGFMRHLRYFLRRCGLKKQATG